MTQFSFDVPRGRDPSLKFTLGPGDIMYMLGANGTGKSSLVSWLFNPHQAHAKRIASHRQTWFESNSLDMTPRSRQEFEYTFRSQDANIPIELALEERQRVVARKNGGAPCSVAELSDGERNAFLIAADILTAKPGTLLLIDEPQRHLHRSIISPLLRLLFDRRRDCSFIVSTHELMLPLDTPSASTLLVRGCGYSGQSVNSWSIDLLEPGAEIDELLKADLLGARRKIVFVGGSESSLDAPLYSLIFPGVSVLPKETCKDVEHAVQGLRSVTGLHWVQAWGIVDNDQRSLDEVTRLRTLGVWALSHYSVEALYYHRLTIERVAKRQSELTGADADSVVASAISSAVDAVREQRNNLVTSAINRTSVVDVDAVEAKVDIKALRDAEEERFDALTATNDWDGLLTRYPVRQSRAFDGIIKTLKIADKDTYQSASNRNPGSARKRNPFELSCGCVSLFGVEAFLRPGLPLGERRAEQRSTLAAGHHDSGAQRC